MYGQQLPVLSGVESAGMAVKTESFTCRLSFDSLLIVALLPAPPLFHAGLFLSSAAVPHLSVGLDQAVALPRDSYLQPYYRDVIEGLRVGPPLFFVVSDINVTREAGDLDKVCSISGCRQDSLASRVSGCWGNVSVMPRLLTSKACGLCTGMKLTLHVAAVDMSRRPGRQLMRTLRAAACSLTATPGCCHTHAVFLATSSTCCIARNSWHVHTCPSHIKSSLPSLLLPYSFPTPSPPGRTCSPKPPTQLHRQRRRLLGRRLPVLDQPQPQQVLPAAHGPHPQPGPALPAPGPAALLSQCQCVRGLQRVPGAAAGGRAARCRGCEEVPAVVFAGGAQ